MNIVFAGTPEFAAVALDALIGAGHEVKLVLTQPDRAAGRGQRAQPSAVKRLALRHELSVLQPPSLEGPGVAVAIAQREPDAMVVAAYGLLVPSALLGVPRLGSINIHASLLPRWRGAAPIQRALIAGDAKTGITIMQMDEGLDTGPILLQETIPIGPEDTARSLGERLAALGGRLIVEALAAPHIPRPQGATGITYAAKIDKREAHIDWSESAAAIERKVRAFDPEPGAFTFCDGVMLKVWRASVERGVSSAPGEVCESGPRGMVVACGVDGLRLIEMQRAGGKRLLAPAFLAGHNVARGTRLG
ncbi:MAG TPA: methionyl-tRNA formyltransferase [Burkholderiales bacterium]|jgi:methionyl-tRNA formyltransferase|nr:methionyl-tRNA formyltransferase [Burkholderiales bacterium]